MSEPKTVLLRRESSKVLCMNVPTAECDYIIAGAYLCAANFHRVTGYHLKPGESRKVRIIIEEVEG